MQIQLRQVEIIAALKQYISQQGIDLTSKTVTISFTAGRKESGISAEMTIEEVGVPAFSNDDDISLKLVSNNQVPAPIAEVPEEVVVTSSTPEVLPPEADKPTKSVSLFS